jgi:hypothetical protein
VSNTASVQVAQVRPCLHAALLCMRGQHLLHLGLA